MERSSENSGEFHSGEIIIISGEIIIQPWSGSSERNTRQPSYIVLTDDTVLLYYCTKNSNVSAVNKRNAESGRSSGKVDEDRRSALEF